MTSEHHGMRGMPSLGNRVCQAGYLATAVSWILTHLATTSWLPTEPDLVDVTWHKITREIEAHDSQLRNLKK